MAEPLSIAASVFALVQAIEMCRKAVIFVCALKNVPDKVQGISVELDHFEAIVRDIELYTQSCGHNLAGGTGDGGTTRLRQHTVDARTEIDELRTVLEYHVRSSADMSLITPFRRSWRSTKKKVARISSRLVTRRSHLQLALTTASW